MSCQQSVPFLLKYYRAGTRQPLTCEMIRDKNHWQVRVNRPCAGAMSTLYNFQTVYVQCLVADFRNTIAYLKYLEGIGWV